MDDRTAKLPCWALVGTVAVVGLASGVLSCGALAQDANPTQLQGVEVTGSRIPRVEKETANPVLTLSAKDIQASGAATLGDVLQSLPLVSGTQVNSQYNYPPSGGAAEIGLRGLTSSRTLLLLDGQRLVSADVNQIPINMIDHIDILKQGASAVYGSDAIAGVVNIITVKKLKGLDVSASYGQSGDHDAGTATANIAWGRVQGRSRLAFGLAFDGNQPIHASDRPWAALPYGFADGQVADLEQGSVSVPNDFIILPVNAIVEYGCSTSFPVLTRIAGTDGSNRLDYRCFNNSPFSAQGSDKYNYQTENYLLSPTQHESAYALLDQKLTDNIEAYANIYYTHTHSKNQQAPEAFNLSVVSLTLGQNVTISPTSIYNPFNTTIGVNYNVDGIYSTLYKRAVEDGDRIYLFDKDTYQAIGGFKGTVFDRFQWNVVGSYGAQDDTIKVSGIPDISTLPQALGPSFVDPTTGTPTCGTLTAPIANCTPIDLLETGGATLAALNTRSRDNQQNTLETVTADINGELFDLWAGPTGFELGYDFRRYDIDYSPDPRQVAFQLFEGNQAPTSGAYNVNEFYGEFLVPLARGLPLLHALNLDFGFRYSKYSTFSATENNKIALEYRPIADLLIRSTYADIFRAPTIQDLYGGESEDAPVYTDPCNGITTPTGQSKSQDDACQNVARDGSYAQLQPQAGALVTSNPNLKPETGYTTDFGLVYSPHWYGPLSIDADYWRYTVKNAINRLSLQSSLNSCFYYDAFCQDIVRDSTGQIAKGYEPETNSDRFDTVGLDFGVHLSYPHTGFGSVQMNVDNTYLQKFDYKVLTDGETVGGASTAGQYNANVFDGGFPRLRTYGTLAWKLNNFGITVIDRFLSNVNEDVPANIDSSFIGTSPCPKGNYAVISNVPTCVRHVGSVNYVDLSASYLFKGFNTELSLGINDLTDEGAQLAYSGPVPDSILSMYSVTGRFFYGRIKVHFD